MTKGKRDVVAAAVLLLIASLLWAEVLTPRYQAVTLFDSGFSPAFFPKILLGLWVVLCVAMLVRAPAVWHEPATGFDLPPVGAAVLACILYVLAIAAIGFLFASVLFVAALPVLLGYRRKLTVALLALLVPGAIWYAFVFLLEIQLPASPWFSRI